MSGQGQAEPSARFADGTAVEDPSEGLRELPLSLGKIVLFEGI
jgi:hypothetical protein